MHALVLMVLLYSVRQSHPLHRGFTWEDRHAAREIAPQSMRLKSCGAPTHSYNPVTFVTTMELILLRCALH